MNGTFCKTPHSRSMSSLATWSFIHTQKSMSGGNNVFNFRHAGHVGQTIVNHGQVRNPVGTHPLLENVDVNQVL